MNLLTPTAYGKHIGKSRQWAWQLIKSGKVKTKLISGKVFVVVKEKINTINPEHD